MVTQCMYSATDNLISGLIFDFRPFNNFGVSVSTAFDDIDLNGLAEGKFDTRLKMALMLGVNYIPDVKRKFNFRLSKEFYHTAVLI